MSKSVEIEQLDPTLIPGVDRAMTETLVLDHVGFFAKLLATEFKNIGTELEKVTLTAEMDLVADELDWQIKVTHTPRVTSVDLDKMRAAGFLADDLVAAEAKGEGRGIVTGVVGTLAVLLALAIVLATIGVGLGWIQ